MGKPEIAEERMFLWHWAYMVMSNRAGVLVSFWVWFRQSMAAMGRTEFVHSFNSLGGLITLSYGNHTHSRESFFVLLAWLSPANVSSVGIPWFLSETCQEARDYFLHIWPYTLLRGGSFPKKWCADMSSLSLLSYIVIGECSLVLFDLYSGWLMLYSNVWENGNDAK